MDDKFLVETFLSDEFNLSKREITLYLNLIKYGASTIFELADVSSMNRSTTHVNIDSLTQKGLVTQIKKGRGSRRLIMAEPTEKLSLILQNKKAKIEAAEEQFSRVALSLMAMKTENESNKNIDIRHYRGKDEVRLIYEDILKAKEIRSYANTADLLKIFPGNIHKFVAAHKKNQNMRIWEIMNDNEESRNYVNQMDPKRFFYRFAIDKLALPSVDYLIFDGKIAMIEASEGIVSGILIENSIFYATSKAIHKFVWSCLQEPQL